MEWAIAVTGLCKRFANQLAVDQFSLQVKQGEIFGFLGPNGSGKTTTLRMLCGLIVPDAGQGHCLGYDILTASQSIKAHVGYMTQHFSLYPDLTVYENLDFVARIYQIPQRHNRIQRIIEQLVLGDYVRQLAGTLSGGWKQRLALGAALLHEPQLLLLDEPTAGVDPKERREFWNRIHHLATQGVTTLVSTHYMDEAERCNRLAYILNGRLLTHGTPQEIIQHAHLTTWLVTGQPLAELATQLKTVPGVAQVTVLGNQLQVTGRDEQLLATGLTPYLADQRYQWQRTPPSLEEVFVDLVTRGEEALHG